MGDSQVTASGSAARAIVRVLELTPRHGRGCGDLGVGPRRPDRHPVIQPVPPRVQCRAPTSSEGSRLRTNLEDQDFKLSLCEGTPVAPQPNPLRRGVRRQMLR